MKKVLITAGPTWSKIDQVRVLTSVFSGQTGLDIARKFVSDCKVDLLMGPGRAKFQASDWQNINIIQFCYYEELQQLLIDKLTEKYDIIIHTAAVSDFLLDNPSNEKTSSSKESWTLTFKQSQKLIDLIRKLAPNASIVKFKLEVGKTVENLQQIALKSLQESQCDYIVVNDFNNIDNKNHEAFVMNEINCTKVTTKQELSTILHKILLKDVD